MIVYYHSCSKEQQQEENTSSSAPRSEHNPAAKKQDKSSKHNAKPMWSSKSIAQEKASKRCEILLMVGYCLQLCQFSENFLI